MEYFPIQNFRPVEAKESSTDQDRSVLRLCEGFAPYPQGAVCAGPHWRLLGASSAIRSDIEAALAGEDATKTHFVTVTRGGVVFLVAWSMLLGKALGGVCIASAASTNLASGAVVVAFSGSDVARGKDSSAPWYGSYVAGRWLLGNGKDDNLIYHDGTLRYLGPSSEPEDPNLRARVRIPPCRVFRQHVNLSLFAAGNLTDHRLRVWICEAPNQREGFLEGIYSLETSYIDIQPHGGASEIVALSVFQQYVTVHTDAKPVNLFGVDTRGNGWKCDQSASAANASAINGNCVGDALGDSAFYLGSDLEVYLDQAVRSGPFEKKSPRSQDIATEQGAGVWNKTAMTPLLSLGYHTYLDRATRLFWMWMPNRFDARPALYAYNDRTRTVAGPWRYPAAIVSMPVPKLAGSNLAIITEAGEFLFADMAAIGEREAEDLEEPGTALGASYVAANSAPTPTPGVPYVALDMTGTLPKIVERVGSQTVGLSSVFGPIAAVDASGWTLSQFFNDAYLARFEFPWQDLGGPGLFKNFLEFRMTIERGSRAYIGIFAETDSGRRGGKWFGLVHPREEVRIPLNLWGQKIRVRVVAVLFNSGRFLVRDAKLGYTIGGAD